MPRPNPSSSAPWPSTSKRFLILFSVRVLRLASFLLVFGNIWVHIRFILLGGILCSQPGQVRVKGEEIYGSRPVGQCASIEAERVAKIWYRCGSRPDAWGV